MKLYLSSGMASAASTSIFSLAEIWRSSMPAKVGAGCAGCAGRAAGEDEGAGWDPPCANATRAKLRMASRQKLLKYCIQHLLGIE